MNNSQFRRLLSETPNRNGDAPPGKSTVPSALGSKKVGFVPMTPRTVRGGADIDFARQVRERNAALQPAKKFKSSVPKGVKYTSGYTDRAKARAEAGEDEDGKAARIKALEEQMKLGQISPEVFDSLRDQITGGDASSTHLVKGLDRQLLERVRRGEDVLNLNGEQSQQTQLPADVEDELDKLAERDVAIVQRTAVEKKGTMTVAGKKRSRDEIMRELKAARQAATQAHPLPALDSRWRKVGEKQTSRIEIDHKGREVLITVDEDGVVKRKVRKMPVEATHEKTVPMLPDSSKTILGSDVIVPETVGQPVVAQLDEDDDIFEGAGIEYNPLGDEPDRSQTLARNYFGDSSTNTQDMPSNHFAGIENVLKKAANINPLRQASDDAQGEDEEQRQACLKRRAEMLAQQDRDLDDMDMGFGSSRFEDEAEADGEGKKVRLSEWKGGDGGWEDGDGEGGKKKQRKPKKREGDANNMADLMRVIEGRKNAGK
ncbi:hypothetical protein BAUCODRAFT_71744 [Baudoinia panamericana UAMH 10762]|uniref:RED-like N-terminal domain-containing protein n=1 Tax=Baudoinia panamericana (strain UAMH 10762) TaxID=717646 RepID=M2MHG5_BAUPA|nr:uncharacterized protein BAUCODRAFT_71744 [Baudoinia panamericana UAMH 10762]EMC96036.1 hypothetical protein BAUCODRAFT_71744 [Baudoinia panamericana UAMH 10762]